MPRIEHAQRRQRGVIRPAWLVLGAVTCIATGTVLNKCMCNPAAPTNRVAVVVQGEFIDSPAAVAPSEPSAEKPPQVTDPSGQLGPRLGIANKPAIKKGYKEITFEFLSNWNYTFPEIKDGKPNRPDPIPDRIKKLNGERVAIRGFMMPFKIEGEDVVEFLLVPSQLACCYGVVPKMNEWLHVTMAQGKKAPYAVDTPITAYGIFDAGELIEQGVVMSLYRMEGLEIEE